MYTGREDGFERGKEERELERDGLDYLDRLVLLVIYS